MKKVEQIMNVLLILLIFACIFYFFKADTITSQLIVILVALNSATTFIKNVKWRRIMTIPLLLGYLGLLIWELYIK